MNTSCDSADTAQPTTSNRQHRKLKFQFLLLLVRNYLCVSTPFRCAFISIIKAPFHDSPCGIVTRHLAGELTGLPLHNLFLHFTELATFGLVQIVQAIITRDVVLVKEGTRPFFHSFNAGHCHGGTRTVTFISKQAILKAEST